jgi:hypothetical protein
MSENKEKIVQHLSEKYGHLSKTDLWNNMIWPVMCPIYKPVYIQFLFPNSIFIVAAYK